MSNIDRELTAVMFGHTWSMTDEELKRVNARGDELWTTVALLHGPPENVLEATSLELKQIYARFRSNIVPLWPFVCEADDTQVARVHRMYTQWHYTQYHLAQEKQAIRKTIANILRRG